MKTKEQYINLLSNFQHKRESFYGISKIGIFGSVARGEQKADSDVDVYYEGESMNLFKMGDLKEELENIMEGPVDVIRIRKSMNKLLKTRIIKDGFYV